MERHHLHALYPSNQTRHRPTRRSVAGSGTGFVTGVNVRSSSVNCPLAGSVIIVKRAMPLAKVTPKNSLAILPGMSARLALNCDTAVATGEREASKAVSVSGIA